MPTFNGVEITSERTIAGLSLAGRAGITIGGLSLTIGAALSMFISGRGDYPDPTAACVIGPGDISSKVYIKFAGNQYFLYSDPTLTTELAAGWYWISDATNIGGGVANHSILIGTSGLVVMFDRCRV